MILHGYRRSIVELKPYQQQVMDCLRNYLSALSHTSTLKEAWQQYWEEQDIGVGAGGVPAYNNGIKGVPHVCMKVPTGGGKTFMACAALRYIFEKFPAGMPKVVVWLVPSNSILTQTIANLSNPRHPYRQRLDRDFQGRVEVYTKEALLNGQNFSPDTVRDVLTICVLGYDTLRINSSKKDIRKVYQENGNLYRFVEEFPYKQDLLENTPDSALIQVLRQLTPVTIVDESHNAKSNLSIQMLNNLNPSFVLDLTATPRSNSNIIAYVDAYELKKENMVKLPVIVYNRANRQNVLQDAIQLRGSLELMAKEEQKAGGAYIRPIVLFQAQPNINDTSATFDKLKNKLVDAGIPQEEIAIKTADVDELGSTDLLSPDCQIRYIITVNALKEGWDCPFAYILASLANKTSKVDVEQIVGRILRQPFARKNSRPLLNLSYVLTCSNDFHETLESVVKGLNGAGFTDKDYRIGSEWDQVAVPNVQYEPQPLQLVPQDQPSDENTSETSTVSGEVDSFADIDIDTVKVNLQNTQNQETTPTIQTMTHQAEQQAAQYTQNAEKEEQSGEQKGELGKMLNQYKVKDAWKESIENLLLPQFDLVKVPDMFGGQYALLDPMALSEGFELKYQNTDIDFSIPAGDVYQVDLSDNGEAVPQYKILQNQEAKFLREHIEFLPDGKQIEGCTQLLCAQLNKNNQYSASDIKAYVKEVIERMSSDDLETMKTAIPTYASKIQEKIRSLEDTYRETQFYKWLDSGKIICRPEYKLKEVISPREASSSRPKSLYSKERNDMNQFEQKLLDAVIALDNVEWWHRIIDRKDFCINGFIKHYPDFLIKTTRGHIVMLEAKGDYLDGDDSKAKLKLGRQWQSAAGPQYRYFMVFEKRALNQDGAYVLDDFIANVMKAL